MKKIFVIITSLIICSNLFAFEFSIGPKASAGISSMYGKNYQDISYKTKPIFSSSAGLAAEIKINDLFYIGSEVVFHFLNGWEYEDDSYLKFKTIEIPILAKAKFDLGPGKISALLGPQFNFISSKIEFYLFEDQEITASEMGFRYCTISLCVGAEYEIPINKGALVFGLRYDVNLLDWAEDKGTRMYAYSFMPSVAYMFKL